MCYRGTLLTNRQRPEMPWGEQSPLTRCGAPCCSTSTGIGLRTAGGRTPRVEVRLQQTRAGDWCDRWYGRGPGWRRGQQESNNIFFNLHASHSVQGLDIRAYPNCLHSPYHNGQEPSASTRSPNFLHPTGGASTQIWHLPDENLSASASSLPQRR